MTDINLHVCVRTSIVSPFICPLTSRKKIHVSEMILSTKLIAMDFRGVWEGNWKIRRPFWVWNLRFADLLYNWKISYVLLYKEKRPIFFDFCISFTIVGLFWWHYWLKSFHPAALLVWLGGMIWRHFHISLRRFDFKGSARLTTHHALSAIAKKKNPAKLS